MKIQYAFTFLIGLTANFAFGQSLPNYATLNSNNVKLVVSANGAIGFNSAFVKGSWMPAGLLQILEIQNSIRWNNFKLFETSFALTHA